MTFGTTLVNPVINTQHNSMTSTPKSTFYTIGFLDSFLSCQQNSENSNIQLLLSCTVPFSIPGKGTTFSPSNVKI